MAPKGMDGSIKEVKKIHRIPTRREKGKMSGEEEDACPEEESNVELHVAMEQLFIERQASIIWSNQHPCKI